MSSGCTTRSQQRLRMHSLLSSPACSSVQSAQESSSAENSALPASIRGTSLALGRSVSGLSTHGSDSRLQVTNSEGLRPKDVFEKGEKPSEFGDGGSPSASTISKEKWKAGTTPSYLLETLGDTQPTELPPRRNTWVIHNTKLLQEYANRQIAPPLVNRVNVQLRHSSQILLGAVQLLANRDRQKENAQKNAQEKKIRPSLPSQLLDGYVDLERWTKEYLRSQFAQEQVDILVPVLLTIISNNFYEAHVHVMDSVVQRALENKVSRKGACLQIEDFAFGFDLHMNQEMPFAIQANHRVRDHKDLQRELFPCPSTPTTDPSPSTTELKPKPVRQTRKAAPKAPIIREPSKPGRKQPLPKNKQDSHRKLGNKPNEPSPLSTFITVDDDEAQATPTLTFSGSSRKAVPSDVASSLDAVLSTRGAGSANTTDIATPGTLIGYESDMTVANVLNSAKFQEQEESEESDGRIQESDSVWFTDMPGRHRMKIPAPQQPNPVPGRSTFALTYVMPSSSLETRSEDSSRSQPSDGPPILTCAFNDTLPQDLNAQTPPTSMLPPSPEPVQRRKKRKLGWR